MQYMHDVAAVAKRHGLCSHIDGARLCNAAVAIADGGDRPRRAAYSTTTRWLQQGSARAGRQTNSMRCWPPCTWKPSLSDDATSTMRANWFVNCAMQSAQRHLSRGSAIPLPPRHAPSKPIPDGHEGGNRSGLDPVELATVSAAGRVLGFAWIDSHLRCPLLSAGSAIQNQLGPIHPVA